MTPADTIRAAVEALEGMLNPIPSPPPDVPGHMWYVDQLKGRRDAADYALSLLHSALEEGEPEPVNVHLLWREACVEWGNAIAGPAEYEIFADKLLASIPPNTPVEAGKVGVVAGVAGTLGGGNG